MNKLAKLMRTTGMVIIASSIIRWFFLFYDPSQMVLGVGIGIITLGFSYIYDWMKKKDEEMTKLNKRLDGFTEWWAKQEMK